MRAAFTLAILCLAIFYTYAAFIDLDFLSSTGRLGPGFFPRIIGVGLIVACLFELTAEFRRRGERLTMSDHAGITALVAVMAGLFILSLNVLGAYVAMLVFMLASLMILNRGRPVQNVATGLLLPTALYLMFEVWLNAPLPDGVLFDRWL